MNLSKSEFVDYYSKQAINEETSLFIGAGVSISAGYPSWKKLLSEVSDQLDIELDKESDLFLLAQFYANRFGENVLKKIISSNINQVDYESELINRLLNLNFSSIWTTNFDRTLEHNLIKKKITANSIFNDKDLANVNSKNILNIYKLNGDISNLEKIIITKKDIEHYQMNHDLFLTFLKKELVTNSFLFLGYSFKDTLILSCLSIVNKYLGDSSNYHYTILKNENSSRFHHFIDDLEKRYHIRTLLVNDYDEIPQILDDLNKKIQSKNIFISGVFQELPQDQDSFANKFCESLTTNLLKRKYKIYSGYGRNLGNYIAGNSVRYLLENNLNIEKKLILRPFLQTMSSSEKQIHRERLIGECNVSIFMYGQSPQDKKFINSKGMLKEFNVAKDLGSTIIPLGVTGYTARDIWDDVKSNIIMYPYLERYIDALNSEIDPENLVKIIIQILSDVEKQ